ncbi:Hypothetical predicted protein [Octopus vulgaris]|uniref:Uncharacterized protein n=1 Tax=Octopus vulgaris TaxID=6645 RepID=A0AA36AH21_OCTVU|nr:Hypothetical predicted protein [Octopus vulgaris]
MQRHFFSFHKKRIEHLLCKIMKDHMWLEDRVNKSTIQRCNKAVREIKVYGRNIPDIRASKSVIMTKGTHTY